ncbi:MAG: DEAD/DEAH box helicase [candidate division Zixibacteria bacterium]|nr:DEAD/DEAH box helicase [candidate division Zixibacteria bacterium]
MEIKKLLKYGIPERIIQTWEENQGDKLLPLQSLAVTRFGLLDGESLIISAPTSSGKTFCGEMAAVSSIFKQRKVIYLVPLKAIAEEKFADFQEKYSSLGIKIAISTRDRREYDSDLEKGDFDLGILIYEKFNQLLLKNLDLLKNIDLLIIDELQMIGDSSRGQILELALLKVLNAGYKPQIIGLSAVLGEVEGLAAWLRCKLLLEHKRPVELLQGILYKGKFVYRKHNSQEEGEEEFIDIESENIDEILLPNIQKMLNQGEQVLVFLKSKNETANLALAFAEKFNGEASSSALEKLSNLEETGLKEKLELCLQKGVAFHNADLSYEERNVVEHSFLENETRVIFATSTLSMGVNLPARTVFIETLKYESGDFTDKGVLVPLNWNEYENMSGRAGRFGLEKDFGRSILLAGNQFQFDSLWDKYIEGKEEKLIPVLDKINLEDIILDLVSSGLVKDYPGLERILLSSYSAMSGTEISPDGGLKTSATSRKFDFNGSGSASGGQPSTIPFAVSVDGGLIRLWRTATKEKISELLEEQMLTSDETDRLSVTTLGKVIALQGIKCETGMQIKRKLANGTTLEPVNWFYELLKTEDGERIFAHLSFYEIDNRVYQNKLKGRSDRIVWLDEELKEMLEDSAQSSLKQLSRLKLSLLFCDWITQIPIFDLESEYGLRSGFISQAAQELAWLLDSASAIARVMNSENSMVKFLKNLATQVQFGINQDMIELAKLRISGLRRDFLWKLFQKGSSSKEQVKEIDLEELKKIIPENLACRMKEKIKLLGIGNKGRGTLQRAPTVSPKGESTKGILFFDGTLIKGRYTIFIDNRKIFLSHKSFKYLFKLAWAAFKKEGGWIHKLDLEEGENQGKYIYRLKKELSLADGKLIENNRIGCYRLNLKKEKIQVNKKVLENFEDYEIKELSKVIGL